ncbi:2-C-methyl-D-erythritol 2,4-cyclodiphosphate synthase [Nitrospirota bacterium]
MRVGTGYDSHRLVPDRPLIIGGVTIPHDLGLKGHSDADVLIHAIIDALMGALGLGDIGKHFPDTDPAYKDADSRTLLRRTLEMLHQNDYEISWVDSTIICESPKLAPHIPTMLDTLAKDGLIHLNIKAKSNEGMGAIGRGEGIAAMATCTLRKVNSNG